MASEILSKISVGLKLDNGTTTTGAIKTVTVSLPAINKAAYDVDKVAAIIPLLVPVLSKTIVKAVKTELKDIRNS